MSKNKKNKAEYLRKKKIKQEAKQKESNHKIDYSSIPDKNYKHKGGYSDLDPLTMMYLLRMGMRRK